MSILTRGIGFATDRHHAAGLLDAVLSRIARLPLSYCAVGRWTAAAEFATIFVVGVGCDFVYHLLAKQIAPNLDDFALVAAVVSSLFCLGMQAQHLYRPAAILHPVGINGRILTTWLGVFFVLLVFGFLGRISQHFSRGAFVSLFVSGAIILPLGRDVAHRILEHAITHNSLGGRRRVVVFGDRRELSARNVGDDLTRHGYHVSRQFHVSLEGRDLIAACREITTVFDRLRLYVQEDRVDEIFLVFATSDQRSIDMVSGRMRELPLPVRLLFDRGVSRFLSQSLLDLGAASAVKLQSGPLSPAQQTFKRVLDVVLAASGLLVLAPLLIAIAVAVRFDSPGPVIFRQRRAGFSGRTFNIYKFRSMTTLDDGAVIRQAVRGDSRVTTLGRYLRAASLDELPQLLNVLKGDMSLVGPRPHALSHDDQYTKVIATYALRHHMKPGITGWAQVNGCRGETAALASMAARIECDLWYIKHWKPLLDIKIILLTVLQVFRPKNVY